TTSESTGTFTTTTSWTHTPVGGGAAPEGVIVFIVVNNSVADDCTTVTYGGTGMAEVALSPNISNQGEDSVTYGYFLGATVPTGAQTVAVTCTGTFTKKAYATSVEATEGDMTVVDTTAAEGVTANPSDTLSLGGVVSYCAMGWFSGVANTGSVNPATDWNSSYELDEGSQMVGMYTYSIIASSDVTFGLSQGNDEYNILGVCIREPAAAGGTRRIMVVN
ncbi:MAG TPA: hypothetical protein VM118_00435, partial [Acidobacteriota bacterium]|nr:hypothetical protein [Acidobacteriota bacterium]